MRLLDSVVVVSLRDLQLALLPGIPHNIRQVFLVAVLCSVVAESKKIGGKLFALCSIPVFTIRQLAYMR